MSEVALPEVGVSLLLQGQTAATAVAAAVNAESHGLDLVALPDASALMRDVYVVAGAIATATSHVRFGPMVTNFASRHVLTTAAAVHSVNELSNGRAFVGVGTGQSSAYTVGGRPMRLTEFASSAEQLRGLLHSGSDGPLAVRWFDGRPVPLFLAASGPRSIAVAAEIADAIVLDVGVDLDLLGECVLAARQRRPNGDLAIYALVRGFIADDIGRAVSNVGRIIPATAERLLTEQDWKRVPTDLRGRLRDFVASYDYSTHGTGAIDTVALAQAAGVWDFLVRRFGLIGNEAMVTSWLRDFSAMSGTGVIFSGAVDELGELVSRLGSIRTGAA